MANDSEIFKKAAAIAEKRGWQEVPNPCENLRTELCDGKLVIKFTMFGGVCPVQAEGTLNDVLFYFRARGNCWSMSVGGKDDVQVSLNPDWYHEELYGEEWEASYMPHDHAKAFVEKSAELWFQNLAR